MPSLRSLLLKFLQNMAGNKRHIFHHLIGMLEYVLVDLLMDVLAGLSLNCASIGIVNIPGAKGLNLQHPAT